MARRKTTKANIPNDTLARARAQVGLNPTPETRTEPANETEREAITPEVVSKISPVAKTDVPIVVQRSTAKRIQDADFERKKKKGELTQELVKEMLLNPTKFPTTDDMRRDYTHVVRDLRNMFLLSGGLVVLLVVLATVLPGA
jgi:hypothetical protein